MTEHEGQSVSLPTPLGELQKALSTAQKEFRAADRSLDGLANFRLVLAFIGLGLLLMPLFTRSGTPWWGLIPLTVVFLALGKVQDRWQERRRVTAASVQYFEGGIDRLEERWRAGLDTGEDVGRACQKSPLHYADDLDLFGKASLFQLLSRAVTAEGRRTLAEWLTHPAETHQEVSARQEAVRVFAQNLDLRRRCFAAAAAGDEGAGGVLRDEALLKWAENKATVPFPRVLRLIGIILPITFLSAVVWSFVLGGSRDAFYLAALIQIGALLWTRRFTAERAAVLSTPERSLNRYARLIEVIETLPEGKAQRLDTLRERLSSARAAAGDGEVDTHERAASEELRSLERWVELLDARLNMFFALTLGPALMWELNIVLRTEDWRRRVGNELRGWLKVIGEVEALASIGAFAHERPDYVFAELADENGVFEAQGLAHPLIDRRRVVPNDLRLEGAGSVLVLSGSNMSGKSTLLRAVGLSLVLGGMGAPVAARGFRLSRFRLATSVRVVDSLAEGASHFYAELCRLKHVTDLAGGDGPPLLYLLDEVLHGTNSRERYLGAVSVVKWLSERGAIGVITTHDLNLARVAELLPEGRVRNAHFSDDVSGDGLQFDYQLRSGPIETTNALRMMRAIGIDVEIVEL